ncbi:MAG TPA: tRNA (guanosine(37)-N1)-methyltransferase TrmD [Firmicutes bacterium]|nr:tRNA (guanosine(37)-N1)-methyltransferase TrmD [Bacillota bacterium]
MRFDLMTLFPEMCERVLGESILGRAQKKGAVEVYTHQIRDYTLNKQKQVDDYPYGGGMGMVMYAQPIADCFRAVCRQAGTRPHLVYMSPQGGVLTQRKALELSRRPNICVLCGHYEGVDERVLDALVDEQISIGDYVLTGGELPALVLIDCVARLVPGVLSDDVCFTEESHFSGLLEYPQYTRPAVWEGREVPEVLLTGHHANIQKWRREQSLLRTLRCRPDMLEGAELSGKERAFLEECRREREAEEAVPPAGTDGEEAPGESGPAGRLGGGAGGGAGKTGGEKGGAKDGAAGGRED